MSLNGPGNDLTLPSDQAYPPSGLILIAEDDPHVLSLLKAVVESRGFRVVPSTSREETLLLCQKFGSAFAVAVLDYSICGSGDAGIINSLREFCPDLKVILTSGYLEADCCLSESELPSYDLFLQKPFRPTDLIDAVRKVLFENVQEGHFEQRPGEGEAHP